MGGIRWRLFRPSRLVIAGTCTTVLALGAGGVGLVGDSAPASTPCVSSGSWPEYLGDVTHQANACSSINALTVDTLHPAWFFGTAGAVSASPAVMPSIGANGSVFDGDSTGVFYSLNEKTGADQWKFQVEGPATTAGGSNCFLDHPGGSDEDKHGGGFGDITSSPTVVTLPGSTTPMLYVGGGSTLFALNALTGACVWAQDTDPGTPTSPIEVESSPVVDTAVSPAEVIVGDDDNSGAGHAVDGLQAFDAASGALLWKYEPERDLTLTPGQFGGSDFYTLACGDGSNQSDPTVPGSTEDTFCDSTNVPGLAPNQTQYADACGDVWSSPALDTSFVDPAGDNSFEGSDEASATSVGDWSPSQITATPGQATHDGLVVFGTGNCAANPTPAAALEHGDYVDNHAIFGLDPVSGHRVWNFIDPYNLYDNNANEPGDGDDDFGSSAVLVTVPATGALLSTCGLGADATRVTLAIEGSKDGYAFGLCESDGAEVWSVQAAQAGQLSPDFVGSIGGFLGSPAVGVAKGRPTVFFTSAIPLPFTNDGIREPGDGDTNISSCPGAGLDSVPVVPPACPDESLAGNPARAVSLHAIDAATGTVIWQAPSAPTYAAASYTNGLVFFPDTTSFSLMAYSANLGTPLFEVPLGSSPASEAAIVGDSVFLGGGIAEGTAGPLNVPPELDGIWGFTTSTSATAPGVTPPPAP